MSNHWGKLGIFCGAVVFVLLVLLAYQQAAERLAWLEKHCEIVAKEKVKSSVGFTANGDTIVTGGHTLTHYKCDDGMTYIE